MLSNFKNSKRNFFLETTRKCKRQRAFHLCLKVNEQTQIHATFRTISSSLKHLHNTGTKFENFRRPKNRGHLLAHLVSWNRKSGLAARAYQRF